ncbi:MAG: hypothetical protein J5778_10950 [Clostridiales bacterium]|nr:hypothetical protein [Clostridiales bacterium]
MNAEDLLRTMSYVDYDLIEELNISEKESDVKRSPRIVIIAAIAAAALAAGIFGINMIRNFSFGDIAVTEATELTVPYTSEESMARSMSGGDIYIGPEEITVGDKRYGMVDINVRDKYQLLLLDEDDVIRKEDLGDLIGEVTDCRDPDMLGHKVYRRKNATGDEPVVIFGVDEGEEHYEYYVLIFDGNDYTEDYQLLYGER